MTDEFIEIPPQQLSPEVLDALLEEFITREGTDYGEYEYSLEDKRLQLRQRLQEGSALIVYDPVSESCTIQSRE